MGLKILIAPDKFKGSLSSSELCGLLTKSIQEILPDSIIDSCPLADGGDGSVEIIAGYLDLRIKICSTVDPLGRHINATYYTSDDTAYIELASASGLVLLDESERNPMATSTYGTGLQIKDALESGIGHVCLFLGGSATNDGGMGIAQALGFGFYDQEGIELDPIGGSLISINRIVPPDEKLNLISLTLCCDVMNLPFGLNGAAMVYAHQKGANEKEIKELDLGIRNLCKQVQLYNGAELSHLAGGGAAGGVSLCLSGLLNASIVSGMDLISGIAMLESKISNADLVITGEGRLDSQSLEGKVVSGVSRLCENNNKRLFLVVGGNELSKGEIKHLGVDAVYSVLEKAKDLNDAMSHTDNYIRLIGREIGLSILNLIL